jgi:hypothetical protein
MPCATTNPDPACTDGMRYWAIVQKWRDGGPATQETRWEANRLERHAQMVYDGHAATCSQPR